jgi:hypothetical protein
VDEEWRLLIELDAQGALATVSNEIVAEIGLHRADNALVAYADSAEAAGAAEHRLREALERRALGHLTTSVEHWNHAEQEWEDSDGSPTEPDDENLNEAEDEDEDEPAGDAWTVSVAMQHHRDAKRLSDQLRMEGWDASASWHVVEVSTRSRDDAETLVAELGMRAPGSEPTMVEA